jgi:hypothetical protein
MSITKFLGGLLVAVSIIQVSAFTVPQSPPSPLDGRATSNTTANLSDLVTWWHETGEINTETPVQNGNVRQSHLYSVEVSTGSSTTYYDSFVYETIPRNGNGQICIPGDLSSICTDIDDQVSIEPSVGITMAWTQFLYSTAVTIKVSRLNGAAIADSSIILRPSNLEYDISYNGSYALIMVPYNPNGVRFSVEFQDDLWTYRKAADGDYYVQDVDPTGYQYVSEYTDSMAVVGIEPKNALLIFASPFAASDLVPNDPGDTYNVPTGRVTGLNTTTKSIVSFGPGVYYCTGTDFANLSSSVTWVYFAPGSYVKGAVQYNSNAASLLATGFGVLSGEQYVYQANFANGFQNVASNADSLHMWSGYTDADGMKWTLHGVTMNAPPFNSMDFYGNLDSFTVEAWDYKQVGAYFGQTDGIEMYPGSHVHDIFYHAGDDTIKTYYSNVLAERIIVWKTLNAPIIQFGWYPRNLTNITVDSVDVIHSRYINQDAMYPRALIGSAVNYLDVDSTSDASIDAYISHYTVSNWRSEGLSPGLIGINPLSNIDTFLVENIWIEELAPNSTLVDMSTFTIMTDSTNGNAPVMLGSKSPNNLGLTIKNYTVGSTLVSFAANNWDSYDLGCLDIDGSYEGKWTVEA